jgi:8-oxo-dGTP diphosphatase
MPDTTVAAIILAEEDSSRVLLTRRASGAFEGMWCLPGGHIDRYETARDAVRREVKEETGLDFQLRSFFHYFDEIFPDYDLHYVALAFVGVGRGTPEAEASEVSDIEWVSLDEARGRPLAFTHNEVLDLYVTRAIP